MVNKDNSERIEKYFREQMSPEESEAFLNDLRNDKELREEAQIMALMIKAMKEGQARQDAETTEKVFKSKKSVMIPAAIKKLRWPLSIAAMLVVIFGGTLLWNNRYSDNDALFHEYYSPYTIQGNSRGSDSDVEKELVALFNQIGTADDITPSINKLQTLYDSIDSEYEYSLYADDITWYLALAYLKNGKSAKAQELLKSLAEKGYGEAVALIEKIE